MTERVNRNLTRMISSYVDECHASWDKYLQQFAFALRSSVNDTTQTTPAELFLGRKILTPFERLINVYDSESQRPSAAKLSQIAEKARQAIQKAQETQKKYYDMRRRESDIKVNDYILVETHFQSSFANVLVKKFAPLYEGPYKVVKVSENNIKAVKASGEEVKCHVSQCRRYNFRNKDKIISPIDYDEGPEITFQPPPPPFSHHSIRTSPTLSSRQSSKSAVVPHHSHHSSSTESANSPVDRTNTPCHSPQQKAPSLTRESADTRSSIAEPTNKGKRKRRTNVHPPGYRHWDLRSGQKSPIPSMSTHYPKRQATNVQRRSQSVKREKPSSVHSMPHKKPKWHPHQLPSTVPSVPLDITPVVPSTSTGVCGTSISAVPSTSQTAACTNSEPSVPTKVVSSIHRYVIPAKRATTSVHRAATTAWKRDFAPRWRSDLTSCQNSASTCLQRVDSTFRQTRAAVSVGRRETTKYGRRPDTTETRSRRS